MNENYTAPPENESSFSGKETIDRGIPSIARKPKGQMVLMSIFLLMASFAMIMVILNGLEKEKPKDITQAQETVFKSHGQGSVPYIEPQLSEPDQGSLQPPPPPLEAPQIDQAAMQREIALQQEAIKMARAEQKRLEERIKSPQIILDEGKRYGQYDSSSQSSYGITGDGAETVYASKIRNPSMTVAQGTMIPGILETAIQSDLPGMLRAIVSDDVYSFDGSTLIIPKGTRLIGQYKSGLSLGQVRVFVIWDRLIRPDAVSITLASYGSDSLGRSGLDGFVDTHFIERFGSSMLLSLIDTGLQIGAQKMDNKDTATVAIETGSDFSSAAQTALEHAIDIPPTIHVDQGKKINVFVGKDLDFSTIEGFENAEYSQ